jgi:hypothetical protein
VVDGEFVMLVMADGMAVLDGRSGLEEIRGHVEQRRDQLVRLTIEAAHLDLHETECREPPGQGKAGPSAVRA